MIQNKHWNSSKLCPLEWWEKNKYNGNVPTTPVPMKMNRGISPSVRSIWPGMYSFDWSFLFFEWKLTHAHFCVQIASIVSSILCLEFIWYSNFLNSTSEDLLYLWRHSFQNSHHDAYIGGVPTWLTVLAHLALQKHAHFLENKLFSESAMCC